MSWHTIVTGWLTSLPGWALVLAGAVLNARRTKTQVTEHVDKVTAQQTAHLTNVVAAAAGDNPPGRTT